MNELLIGGRYRLVREIARGATAAVWEAEDLVLQRRVAVKYAHEAPASGHASGREAVLVALFAHPNVVRVYDAGADNGRPYTVMEFLEGEDLARRIERVGRVSVTSLIPWLTEAALALDAAHASGVAHGDLKLADLFFTKSGGQDSLKVLGFGGASGEGDAAGDLRSLASLAWHALTGRSIEALLADGASAPAPSQLVPELSAQVDAFFARALHADAAARFQSAREFSEAVRALGAHAEATRATRVLVVDDEPDVESLIRQRYRQQIRKGVYEFLFASNGADAMRVLQANPDVDIVLSDINMPEMDGLTFLANARAVNPLRRVVMVSAYGDMINIRAAMNHGAFDFITKPVDMADLDATIRKAVAELVVVREAIRRWTEAERARANLARYFPPNLVEMLASSDAPMRAARRADVGVLFADIMGFTQFAESVSPEEVLALLREFHGKMEAEVFQHGGTLEKYIGDALLATFGTPVPTGRDATHALACARAMLLALAGLNRARVARGESAIRMGIGLHWGAAVLGDIGSDRNMAFAVIGDTVNTASRLQSATRELGAALVVSQDLLDAVRAELGGGVDVLVPGLEDIGERTLRGRVKPLRLWLLREDGAPAAATGALLDV